GIRDFHVTGVQTCALPIWVDARGFLLGAGVATTLGTGVLAVRKRGKLPPPVITREYQLEYGTAALEVPATGVELAGRRVLLLDRSEERRVGTGCRDLVTP